MLRVWFLVSGALALLGVVAVGNAPAAAQQASPAASPAVVACTVAPRAGRPTDRLLVRAGRNPCGHPAGGLTPVASAAELPQGEPADADRGGDHGHDPGGLRSSQRRRVRPAVGAVHRPLPLGSSVRSTEKREAQTRAFVAPAPRAARPAGDRLRAARCSRPARRSSRGALLEVNGPARQTAFIVFVRDGDRWLVDEFVPLPTAATPDAGTPPPY